MKNKSMLIVIALCAGLQSGTVLGSQNKGWGTWISDQLWGSKKEREEFSQGWNEVATQQAALERKKRHLISKTGSGPLQFSTAIT